MDRVDAATGERVWRAEVEAPQDLAMSDGTLYVSHFDGVSLLDPADGTLHKTFAQSNFLVFDIAVSGHTLCIDAMADDRVHGLDAPTGRERWSADLGQTLRRRWRSCRTWSRRPPRTGPRLLPGRAQTEARTMVPTVSVASMSCRAVTKSSLNAVSEGSAS
ncbi:PQQ-binding-like beta-propeller repeat protein [Streptomyces sp. NPDC015220]|uniref:outer membrane protein assembly factor BamB family protein n=1 Tax=Streptomyces sp. NPDC015220 TaxID=3364947 RepID=UPI0036FB2143